MMAGIVHKGMRHSGGVPPRPPPPTTSKPTSLEELRRGFRKNILGGADRGRGGLAEPPLSGFPPIPGGGGQGSLQTLTKKILSGYLPSGMFCAA